MAEALACNSLTRTCYLHATCMSQMCLSQAQDGALGLRLPIPAIAACSQLVACSQHLRLAASMQADDVCDDADKRRRYKRIDEAEATGFLGKGSFGKVYIAEDTLTGGVVAVKRQRYPSTEAAKELAFAKTVASNPSAPASK